MVLFPISITRFEAMKAHDILKEKGYKVSVIHQLWLKPFVFKETWNEALKNSKYGGIVLDDDYEDGVSKSLAHEMMLSANKEVYTLGLEDRTAGFHSKVDNLPPSAEKIVDYVLSIVENK